MTDIHDLDRHIGRYVSLEEDGDSASGFLVDVHDEVDYTPNQVRWIVLDWGQGWRVSERTVLTFPGAPDGETCTVVGPVRRIHLVMHGERVCRTPEHCTFEGMAVRAVREIRIWRMKQNRAYWQWRYLGRARQESAVGVEGLIAEAVSEGAPAEFVDHLQIVKQRAVKKEGQG